MYYISEIRETEAVVLDGKVTIFLDKKAKIFINAPSDVKIEKAKKPEKESKNEGE